VPAALRRCRSAWWPAPRQPPISALIAGSSSFQPPGRFGGRVAPGGDALGPVALIAAIGHVLGDLVAALGERLTQRLGHTHGGHCRPRPSAPSGLEVVANNRAFAAACRWPTMVAASNNSRSAAESRPLDPPWRRASRSSSSPGCNRAGPNHPPETWRDGYGRRSTPRSDTAPAVAPSAVTDLQVVVEPLHRGVGVGVITAVVMTTRGQRGSPT
jgi:hypothetical protein